MTVFRSKTVEKEAFKIIEARKPYNGFVRVVLENQEVLDLPISGNPVEKGDYVVTQSPTDRYHCPANVMKKGYTLVETSWRARLDEESRELAERYSEVLGYLQPGGTAEDFDSDLRNLLIEQSIHMKRYLEILQLRKAL